jgi:hypothetical protein
MKHELKQILSVSRRTDIPAFYMPWFMDRVSRGVVEVVNPFNRQVKQVAISPQRIHTMVFWSKNFGPFLAGGYGDQLQAMGYHLFFNFTVNSRAPELEPGVPDLEQRLDQLRQLCHRFGAASVQWRFDPICHYTIDPGVIETNLGEFETIAAVAGECGIDTCTTSFMDHYRKIGRRTRGRLTFVEPSPAERVRILTHMEQTLGPLGIHLALCCEKIGAGQASRRICHQRRGMHFGPADHGGSWRSDIPSSGCRPTQSGGVRLHRFRGCWFLQPSPLPSQLPVLLCQPGLRPEA